MADQKQLNAPQIGMNTDINSFNLKENQYPYALNAKIESNSQEGNLITLQNESSNILSVNFPQGFKVIGKRSVPELNRTLFFLINDLGESRIGEVINCNYSDDIDDIDSYSPCVDCNNPIQEERKPLETIDQQPYCSYYNLVTSNCLGFSIDYPVRIQYKIKDCKFEIYFTDDLNQRRYMYFDFENGDKRAHLVLQQKFYTVTGFQDDDCAQPIYSTELDCNKIAYHPQFTIPCIANAELVSGGACKAGTVQFMLAYCDDIGIPFTNFFPSSNPLPIFTKQLTFETNYQTDRAVKVTIDNLDQTELYKYYIVAVAETVDNFTDFKRVGIFPVTQSTFTYSGREADYKKMSADEIFFRRPFYKTATNVTKSNDYLFFSGPSEWSKPNLQRVANKVKLYWQSVAIPEPAYFNSNYSELFRGHQRDEVYAYGMVFVTDVGEELGTYHIPGPSKDWFSTQYGIDVDEPVNNDDINQNNNCEECADCEQVDNSTITGTFRIVCFDDNCHQQGEPQVIMTFNRPLPVATQFLIGTETNSPLFPSLPNRYVGSDIFTPNPGTIPQDAYDNPNAKGHGTPFYVNVPAGATSFQTTPPSSTSDIGVTNEIFQVGVNSSSTFLEKAWSAMTCHSCQVPLVHVWVKPVDGVGNNFNLTTTSSFTLHNVPNDVVAEPPTPLPDCCTNAKWKVYNTAFVIDSPHELVDECKLDSVWEWGEWAYWESEKRYPNDPEIWGELCGEHIRHHKYPDSLVTHIHDSKDGSKSFQDRNIVFPVGVRVNHQSVKDAIAYCVANNIIKAADAARIKSYYIVRGNRVGHKSIVAKGLLYDMWSYDKFGHTYYYPNFPYNDLRQNKFISNDENTYEGSNTSSPVPSSFSASGRYTFHSPDIHFTNPLLGTQLKLETLEYGSSEGFFDHCEEEAKYKFLSTASMTLAFAAGVAAAFSANVEKDCTNYTVKSASVGTDTSTWSNMVFTKHDKVLSIPIPVVDPASLGPGVESYTKTTCKGTTFQLLSPSSAVAGTISPVAFMLQQFIYLGVLSIKEIQIMSDLIKALVPLKNFAIQYNSAGIYNNYKTVANAGKKIRRVLKGAYLNPMVQTVDEPVDTTTNAFTTSYINNWNRESSVYLKLDNTKLFDAPSVTDSSRVSMDDVGLEQEDLNKNVYRNISSYYGSVKNYVPDQYGFIGDVDYVSTGRCRFLLSENYAVNGTSVFGGDTFITRFALKRKHPFFLQTRFRQNNESDVRYSDLGNAGYPNYYFNVEQSFFERLSGNTWGASLTHIMAVMQDLLGVANSRLDAKKNKLFYQSGFIHLYNYGIPYFLCESDVNVDYRTAQNNKERDFYPHNKDLKEWLQERTVPIKEDNYYFYNTTYSKQNKETVLSPQVSYLVQDCEIKYPSSVIQSEQDIPSSTYADQWLIFKANNKQDFAASNGPITGVNGIENDKVLVRFENGTQIFNAYDTLKTELNVVQVGTGGTFAARPKEFSVTNLGYAGSQHDDLLQTEFGHIFVDAKRGQVFNLAPNASGMDEIAKDGMKNWFKENLPFQILKDFPTFQLRDADNNFKGVGLHMAFDKRFSRFLITKLDYKKLKPVTYDPDLKKFYFNSQEVKLTDKNYFCDKSWTVSYNFLTQSWVSYHSFKPNYYVDQVEHFESGLNSTQSTLWSHNLTNKSYQVYYGKLQPFTVTVASTPMLLNSVLNSVQFVTDTIRYHNKYDTAYNRLITFNKAIVFNDQQTSAPLNLNVRNENNLYESLQYPKVNADGSIDVLVTRDDERWVFNQFWDAVTAQNTNQPLFLSKCNNCEKEINLKALNLYKPDVYKQPIRGKQTKVTLTQDKVSNYSLLFHFSNFDKGSY